MIKFESWSNVLAQRSEDLSLKKKNIFRILIAYAYRSYCNGLYTCRSKFAEVLERQKPLFDPKDKTFEEYVDEYYKLDCEDVIGDLPCRLHIISNVPSKSFNIVTLTYKFHMFEHRFWAEFQQRHPFQYFLVYWYPSLFALICYMKVGG